MRATRSTDENADLDTVTKDVASLKSDIGKLVDHMKTDAVGTVASQARRAYGSLTAEGERSTAAIARKVEQRPFASLLIAFAAGFIGSRMLMR